MSNVPPPSPTMNFQTPSGGDPASKVKGPGMALMIVGIIGIIGLVIGIIFGLLGISMGAMQGGNQGMANMASGALGLIMRILFIILQSVMVFGGIKMQKLQSYNIALTGAVLACIPCVSPCCILGIPFGIWALVVLMKPEVKAAFTA